MSKHQEEREREEYIRRASLLPPVDWIGMGSLPHPASIYATARHRRHKRHRFADQMVLRVIGYLAAVAAIIVLAVLFVRAF